MKTLKQLVSNTPSEVIGHASETRVFDLKMTTTVKKDMQTLQFRARGHAMTDKTMYDLTIEMYPIQNHRDVYRKPAEDNFAWVACSCPYFLYHCEYALAKAGSSEINFSNGKPPYIRNPKMVPYLCKHLYKAAPLAIKLALDAAKRDPKFKFV